MNDDNSGNKTTGSKQKKGENNNLESGNAIESDTRVEQKNTQHALYSRNGSSVPSSHEKNGNEHVDNTSGGSPEVVKDGMDSGCMDPKVVEGVNEPVIIIPKSFASLVTNKAATSKVNFRSLNSDKLINAKAEVKIPKASILDGHLRFGFSIYGYYMGKRVAFLVVDNYVKNAWQKFDLIRVHLNNDEDDEPTPQPKPKEPKLVKETLIPKSYKPKIPYPQRLRKEKMEAQYGKFLDMIRAVRINIPLVDVLARMPNYGKFLKELMSNKHKIEQISAAFLSDESSAIHQNKVPPKLGDPGSFLITCNFNEAFSCNALSDLGANINLMPCSLYAKLSLETLKPTKMNVRLADRSFQYPIGIAENMLVEVGKFNFPADFVILEIEEDKEDFDALLDEGSEILYSIEGTILEETLFVEFDEFTAMTTDKNSKSESDTEEPPFEKITFNIDYYIKTSLEEPPTDLEFKTLSDNLEYVFLEEPSFLLVIISSQLSKQNKNKLVSVLKRQKQAFAWKTTDIPEICPSFCKHKI
ncbi:reverse transcriptase domain-containing protein [Tanacetum coccineum]